MSGAGLARVAVVAALLEIVCSVAEGCRGYLMTSVPVRGLGGLRVVLGLIAVSFLAEGGIFGAHGHRR